MRPVIRLVLFTAFLFFVQTTVTHAQRSRNTVLYSSDNIATGQLSGTITTESGPLSGFTINLIHDGTTVLQVVTGEDGSFVFKELAPGHYELTCSKTGYRKRVVQEVPIIEEQHSTCGFKMFLVENWHDERAPSINVFENLKIHNIVKLK